jgi:hypothetical protein
VLCKSCHYPLKQLAEPRCPECGREFDPGDPSTFDASQPIWKKARRRLLIIGCCIYPVLFLLLLYRQLGNHFRSAPPVKTLQGTSITFTPASSSETLLQAAVDGIVIWPFAFIAVSLAYLGVIWAIPRLSPGRRTSRRPILMLCATCRCPFRGVFEPRCPECGRKYDPDNSNTYVVPSMLKSRYWLWLLIAGGAISLCIFAGLYCIVATQSPPGVFVNHTPSFVVTVHPMPMSSRVLRVAVLALILWPVVVVVLVLCSLPFGYAHQVEVLCDKVFRLPDN